MDCKHLWTKYAWGTVMLYQKAEIASSIPVFRRYESSISIYTVSNQPE